MMQERQSGLSAGDLVSARQAWWRVTHVARFPSCELLRLAGADRANAGVDCALLFPFDRPVRRHSASQFRLASRRRWGRAFRQLAADERPYGSLWSAAGALIDILAFQLEPALAVVRHMASRVLLADDVGLGKTIQAGLIIAELEARSAADRVLILTPAGLRDQWARELADRFSLRAEIVDADTLARRIASLPPETNPWTLAGIKIVSFEFVKQPEVLQALAWVIWDLVLVDEAHASSGNTERGRAIRRLAARARRVVMATATPHSGDARAFAALCDIGRLAAAPDREPVLMFRRSRADVGIVSRRRPHLLPVTLTLAERHMHWLLDDYARRVWREASSRGHDGALVAMTVLKKRALSSARSLAISAARRLAQLAEGHDWTEAQLPLPLSPDAGETDDADQPPDRVLAAPGLDDPRHERAWLGVIHAAARTAAASESKMRRLVRLIARAGEPTIVFTEYRDTLERIAVLLSPVAAVARLHGGMTRGERLDAEQRFTSGAARVLVATDAAGEGLNLQARCRLVINLELPWTPGRLEQRIGRVDRIGQRQVVHAIHLVAEGTDEARILARLTARLRAVREALGQNHALFGAIPERLIAEAWIRGDPLALSPAATTYARRPTLPVAPDGDVDPAKTFFELPTLRAVAVIEAARIVEQRRLRATRDPNETASLTPRPGRSVAWVLSLRSGRLAWRCARRGRPGPGLAGLTCIFRGAIVDGSGDLLEVAIVPVHVSLPELPHARSRHDVRALLERWLSPIQERLIDLVRRRLADRVVAVQPLHARGILRARDRESTLADTTDEASARPLVQPGLFDRRALREADRLRNRVSALRGEADQRLARLTDALDVLAQPEIELALVLAVGSDVGRDLTVWQSRWSSASIPPIPNRP